MRRLPVLVLGAVTFAVVVQQVATTAADELSTMPVGDVVASLGSDDYMTRVAATKRLARAGTESIEAVKAAAAHADPEVAWRVRMILVDIGITGDEATHKRIVQTLEGLATDGNASFENLGPQVTRWRQIRSLPPEQQIHHLNAFISGGGVVDPVFVGRLRGC